MFDLNDTICATATPYGKSAIAIIRISGKDSLKLLKSVFVPRYKKESEFIPRKFYYGEIIGEGRCIDEVNAVFFKSPYSYTGEDSVEIYCHGNMVIVRTVLDLLLSYGARMAERGEFTRRAFLNGKIDLVQAEAVINLIDSKSSSCVDVSLGQLKGELSSLLNEIKADMKAILTALELNIDFSEHEINTVKINGIKESMCDLKNKMNTLLSSFKIGSVIKDGIHVVILGRPNAGKSSILNLLVKKDKAIVSDIPGTTRDPVEEIIELDGILFRLVDTAGIMDAEEGSLEYISINKTREHFEDGDLILFVVDASVPITKDFYDIYEKMKEKELIIILNKSDLGLAVDVNDIAEKAGIKPIIFSAVRGDGVDILEREMVSRYKESDELVHHNMLMRLRHKNSLERALCHIEDALCVPDEGVEIISYNLRNALELLKELLGEIYTDDILNSIFEQFCIGK